LLRHASTVWNEEGRLQGMTDTILSPKGEADARTWRLPSPADGWKRMCSPLKRACRYRRAVAAGRAVAVDQRLREIELRRLGSRTVLELRETVGPAFVAAENKGLDFQPPGGESPRTVMERITGWTAEIAEKGEPIVAVSHKAAIARCWRWRPAGHDGPPTGQARLALGAFLLRRARTARCVSIVPTCRWCRMSPM